MKLAKNIYLLIGVAIFLILFNTIFIIYLIDVNRDHYRSAGNSHHIIQISTELLSLIKDAETGQRGYIITDDRQYLAPFQNAKKRFEFYCDSLKQLTDTTTYSTADLDRLHDLLNERMDELSLTVELKRRGNTQEAINIIQEGNGEKVMSEIRQGLNSMIAEEKVRLTAYQLDITKYTRRIKIYAGVSNGLLLTMAVASLINIRNNRKKINALFAENEEKNRLLEEQTADLQRLSHDLIQQNRELERFAYVASHDIRAPAANLEALLRLYREAKDKRERDSLIDTMQDVSENLSNKLNDLVEGLRGKNEIERLSEKLNLHSIFDKIVQNLSVDIRKANAHIVHDFAQAPEIVSVKSYIESILQNLISNAIKYRDPSRKLEIMVRSYKQQGKVCIAVSDNGLGIDLEKHGSQLFGLYKTFHNNRNSKGVGLYITRAQVLSLGGRIDVDSTPGKGSTFSVCL